MEALDKAFDLLEYVLLQNGRAVTPSEAALATRQPLSTATRILGELTARGYLDKISRKSGYAPGPMVPSLANRDNIYHRLAVASVEPIRELSLKIRRQVNLSVMRNGERIMLVYSGPSFNWKPWSRFTFDDHGMTATGRLLLAELPEDEALAVAERFPVPHWPEASDPDAFLRECARIRRDKAVLFPLNDMMICGHLIRVEGYPPAAFGFGTTELVRADEFFEESRKCAEKITNALIRMEQTF